MDSLDLIPKGSSVLLTAPVIIYGIFAKKGTHEVPFSEQCNRLLNSCRTNYYAGIITTATVSKCWQILEQVSSDVTNWEEDVEAGVLASKFKRPVQTSLPKRISGLLFGELEVAPIDQQTFESAANLVKASRLPRLPISIALDIAAASKVALEIATRSKVIPGDTSEVAAESEDNPPPLFVALAAEPWWSPPHNCNLYCADDLPWQLAERPPGPFESIPCKGTLKQKAPEELVNKRPRKILKPIRFIRKRKRKRKGETQFSFMKGEVPPQKK